MAVEIERKFLVRDLSWMGMIKTRTEICQGYLSDMSGPVTVRVRTADDQAFLTVKENVGGCSRQEIECPIPLKEARELLSMCQFGQIDKTRYVVPYRGKDWEVDVFGGLNRGLIIAEIELLSESDGFVVPPWVGSEVTHDTRYFNLALAKTPFTSW